MKRRLFIAGVLALVGAGGGWALIRHASRVSDEQDFVCHRVELPPEQNAFSLWTNAIARFDAPRMSPEERSLFVEACTFKTNRPLSEISVPLSELIDARRDVYAWVGQALERPLQYPLLVDYDIDGYGSLSGWVNLANLKIVAGRLCAERGEYDAAVREYLDVVRMGRRMSAGEGPVVMSIVSMGVQGMGLRAICRLCADERVPVAVMRKMLEQLPLPPATDNELERAYEIERVSFFVRFRNAMRGRGRSVAVWVGSLAESLLMDLPATERGVNEVYACYQTNALCASWAACDRRLLETYERLSKDADQTNVMDWSCEKGVRTLFQSVWMSFRRPNLLGEIMLGSSARAADSALKNSFKARTRLDLTRAFIALRIVRRETGAYPASLDAIVSCGLLAERPIDFFDGQPLRYSKEQRRLWSIGDAFFDKDGLQKKDLVVALPE